MGMIEQQEQQRAAEELRWAAIHEFASEQGLALLQVSARKYQIIRFGNAAASVQHVGVNQYIAVMPATVLLTGTYPQCMDYLKVYCTPLPPELCPQ